MCFCFSFITEWNISSATVASCCDRDCPPCPAGDPLNLAASAIPEKHNKSNQIKSNQINKVSKLNDYGEQATSPNILRRTCVDN